jgi:hypothetical protein
MLAYEMHGYIFDEYLLPMPVPDVIIKYLEHLFTLFSMTYLFYILHIFNANNSKPDSPDIMRRADGYHKHKRTIVPRRSFLCP